MTGFTLSHLRIDVHGYEFSEASDYHDANWLEVSAKCEYCGISTTLYGPYLSAPELLEFRDQVQCLLDGEVDSASLSPMEPAIQIALKKRNSVGGLLAEIELRPLPQGNLHQFEMELDQSYLSETLGGLDGILDKFPVRMGE